MTDKKNTFGIIKTVCRGKEIKVAYLLDDEERLLDIDIDPVGTEEILGCIYIGRVEKLINGGAFVRITSSQRAFLNVRDSDEKVNTGDLIPVSVIKDARGTKLPVISRRLSVYGRYTIVSSMGNTVSVSRKLDEEKRNLIKCELSKISETSGFDILIRSSAGDVPLDEVCAEVVQLTTTLDKMLRDSESSMHIKCLYDPDLKKRSILDRARDVSGNFPLRVISDDRQTLLDIKTLYRSLYDEDDTSFVFYGDSVSLETVHRIGSRIEKLLSRQIYLKHGVEIVIDPVEACTIIDINYASYNKGQKSDESFYNANIIAAREIFRQIRLRNISGIILVDLINMSDESRDQFMKQIKREAEGDPCKLDVLDITKLGMLEMTRQRTSPSIGELFG